MQIPDIDKRTEVLTINNGVNLDKYIFKERANGFKVAYVGYIHSRKNPILLLQIIKSLIKKDKRYKLYLAGKFQDPLIELYFKYQIEKMDLQDNVFFEGWQDNISNWLEDKSYIISTSIHESFGYGIAEAMARGIKPVIHDFLFAEEIWPKKYLFNTIDEAVDMITSNEYNSAEYRDFIETNYSLEKQMESTLNLLKNLNSKREFNIVNYKLDNIYDFSYAGKNIKFYLPYLNDHIQKIIYLNRNFYELSMLEDIKGRLEQNKIVVDVGANIGNHTVYFSKICEAKMVYAFEPQKEIFDILKKNIEINELSHSVKLFNMGVGKEHGYGSISVVDPNNYGMTRLNKDANGQIEIVSLDSILLEKVPKVDMIKIDVEGMEVDVLIGADKILKKFKPLIYIEAGTDYEFNEISKFLNKYKYKSVYRFNATPTYLFL